MRAIRAFAKGMVPVLLAAVLLSSCTFFDFFSVDSLIRPPRLTGESALIEQAFEAAVGKDVMLISPVAGAERSAFVQYDVDKDGEKETLVFYTRNDAPNEAHMHILKFDGADWFSVGDVTGNGSEVYSVSFYDLDRAAGMEIAVCWTVSDSRRNKTLSLYQLAQKKSDKAIVQLSVLQVYDYLVDDFDFDGQQELLYLMDNSLDQEQPFKASMIKMGGTDGVFYFVCELQLARSVNLPVKISCDMLNGSYRLYIDCLNYDGTYMTEIMTYDVDANVLLRPLDAYGTPLSNLTVRHAELYCDDVNNDRVIEIPTESTQEGFTILADKDEAQEPMRFISYVSLETDALTPQDRTYFYAPDGTYRFRMDEFLTDYTAVYAAATGTLRFYALDAADTPVFAVRCVAFSADETEVFVSISDGADPRLTETYIKRFAEIL